MPIEIEITDSISQFIQTPKREANMIKFKVFIFRTRVFNDELSGGHYQVEFISLAKDTRGR